MPTALVSPPHVAREAGKKKEIPRILRLIKSSSFLTHFCVSDSQQCSSTQQYTCVSNVRVLTQEEIISQCVFSVCRSRTPWSSATRVTRTHQFQNTQICHNAKRFTSKRMCHGFTTRSLDAQDRYLWWSYKHVIPKHDYCVCLHKHQLLCF